MDFIKEFFRKRRECLVLLEYFAERGWRQQVGMDAELVSDDRRGHKDL
jgi:hypothetical protein